MFPTDLGNRRVSSDIISINVHGIPEMQTLPDPVQIQFQVRFQTMKLGGRVQQSRPTAQSGNIAGFGNIWPVQAT